MNLDELTRGNAGSAQYLAYRIRSALCPIRVFGLSLESKEERQWAIEQFTQALETYDVRFFADVADGLKKLRSSSSPESRGPKFFLLRAYNFLRRESPRLPFRKEVIELTLRMWAATCLTGRIPRLPLPAYESDFERRMEPIIRGLSKKKWHRYYKPLDLEFSPAKRGPKTGDK